MSNETARALAFAGGILNLIGGLVITSITSLLYFFLLWTGLDPSTLNHTLFLFFLMIGIFATLLGILPVMWRNDPENHQAGLIIIGAITILSIGGILNLAAGITATKEEAVKIS